MESHNCTTNLLAQLIPVNNWGNNYTNRVLIIICHRLQLFGRIANCLGNVLQVGSFLGLGVIANLCNLFNVRFFVCSAEIYSTSLLCCTFLLQLYTQPSFEPREKFLSITLLGGHNISMAPCTDLSRDELWRELLLLLPHILSHFIHSQVLTPCDACSPANNAFGRHGWRHPEETEHNI